jgi:nicotinate-nucleotide pyrophosphorylase (carboxylating)
MCGTATVTESYVAAVVGTGARILDTRKTVPGLRLAQKYAVRCGGGVNHRFGLFDAILIKENHILASGGIAPAVATARKMHAELPVEVEVESIDELRQALAARCERILLDNFSTDDSTTPSESIGLKAIHLLPLRRPVASHWSRSGALHRPGLITFQLVP